MFDSIPLHDRLPKLIDQHRASVQQSFARVHIIDNTREEADHRGLDFSSAS